MASQDRVLATRNEVFDEIANLTWGSSVLVLDETHFESTLFLQSLLRDFPSDKIRIISPSVSESPLPTVRVSFEKLSSLNDMSIQISSIRDEVKPRGVIIHNTIPHLLIRENQEEVLKMLEFWSMRTIENELVEFYTLPGRTFPEIERKTQSFFQGEIRIGFQQGEKRELTFQIKKIAKPQYHLEEFPFKIQCERLLIKWGDFFTDHIPSEETHEINRIVQYMKENLNSIVLSPKDLLSNQTSTYERWLLSQVQDKYLREMKLLYPDTFDDLLEALARLNIRKEVSFRLDPIPDLDGETQPEHLGIRTRLGLKLPLWLSYLLFYKKARYVTIDAFIALRNAIDTFAQYSPPELARKMAELQRYYQELSSRTTAIERIASNREDPRTVFDLKYFTKIVGLTLRAGFQIKPKIESKSGGIYEISVEDCPICRGQKSADVMCDLISGAVVGVCGVTFKRKFSCEEVKCIGRGDRACLFIARPI